MKGGRKREKNIYVWEKPLSVAQNWEPVPQPRQEPWLGIKRETFWLAGWRLAHWSIPLRAMLIDFRERGRGRERGRETSMWERNISLLPLICTPINQGPNLPPMYVPWLGIEPATFQFTGWHSNQLSHTSQGSMSVFLGALWVFQDFLANLLRQVEEPSGRRLVL